MNVDTKKLQQLYADNRTVRMLLDELGSRERNRRVTKTDWVISRFRSHDISRGEGVAMFREFEGLSLGKYIEGRKGHPSRFEWSVGTVGLAKLASGERAKPEELRFDPQTAEDEDSAGSEALEHVFALRPDQSVRFILPSNLTRNEAERLAGFIQALPFA